MTTRKAPVTPGSTTNTTQQQQQPHYTFNVGAAATAANNTSPTEADKRAPDKRSLQNSLQLQQLQQWQHQALMQAKRTANLVRPLNTAALTTSGAQQQQQLHQKLPSGSMASVPLSQHPEQQQQQPGIL